MNRPVLYAGLLGGLLGAVFSFALARALPPTPKPPPPALRSEARQYADEVIAKLKSGNYDSFFAALRPGFSELNDEQFQKLRENNIEMRKNFVKEYGPAGEFEFARETELSPSVVRITYVEKYERGCVVCFVVVYNSAAGWRVLAFGFQPLESAFASAR